MFKLSKKKYNKGFTLVELIVVIAILAILVGLLAPQYTKYVEKSRKSADVSNLENLVTGLKVAASDHEYKLGDANKDVAYFIAITNKGAIMQKKTVSAANATFADVVANDPAVLAIDEYSGHKLNVLDTSLATKSKKWGTDNNKYGGDDTTSQIYATVTIKVDDSVTVDYSSNVTQYSKDGKLATS